MRAVATAEPAARRRWRWPSARRGGRGARSRGGWCGRAAVGRGRSAELAWERAHTPIFVPFAVGSLCEARACALTAVPGARVCASVRALCLHVLVGARVWRALYIVQLAGGAGWPWGAQAKWGDAVTRVEKLPTMASKASSSLGVQRVAGAESASLTSSTARRRASPTPRPGGVLPACPRARHRGVGPQHVVVHVGHPAWSRLARRTPLPPRACTATLLLLTRCTMAC